ncbi:MAG: fumarylacetoacetate hydrolase family protein [Chloroflexota bacterium]
MRIIRFAFGHRARYGVLDSGVVHGLRVSPFVGFHGGRPLLRLDGSSHELGEVRLLAPCRPSKIVAVGLNYRSHAAETRMPLPSVPLLFLKPSTAVVGPDENIILPGPSGRVDYEGELGVVVGRRARNVPADRAQDYILGYTCVNDVTEREMQKSDGQWTRAKGFDTFAPLGPWIETELDPGDLKVETRLNGEVRQSASTSDLIFGVAELAAFVSGVMTLLPGDVISTGTPSGIGRMKAGDVVEVAIQGIGTLRNFVVAAGPGPR